MHVLSAKASGRGLKERPHSYRFLFFFFTNKIRPVNRNFPCFRDKTVIYPLMSDFQSVYSVNILNVSHSWTLNFLMNREWRFYFQLWMLVGVCSTCSHLCAAVMQMKDDMKYRNKQVGKDGHMWTDRQMGEDRCLRRNRQMGRPEDRQVKTNICKQLDQWRLSDKQTWWGQADWWGWTRKDRLISVADKGDGLRTEIQMNGHTSKHVWGQTSQENRMVKIDVWRQTDRQMCENGQTSENGQTDGWGWMSEIDSKVRMDFWGWTDRQTVVNRQTARWGWMSENGQTDEDRQTDGNTDMWGQTDRKTRMAEYGQQGQMWENHLRKNVDRTQ